MIGDLQALNQENQENYKTGEGFKQDSTHVYEKLTQIKQAMQKCLDFNTNIIDSENNEHVRDSRQIVSSDKMPERKQTKAI